MSSGMGVLVRVERLRQQSEVFQSRVETELRRTIQALLEELLVRQAERRAMEAEWTRTISDGRLVKFTYLDLPEGTAFMTAQIAGHDVVYSVIVPAEHPFNREGVERRFAYECPTVSH
jgi:hypothetical protein